VAPPLLGPVTAAEYVRLRRERMKLTVRQVAERMVAMRLAPRGQLQKVIDTLQLLEAPGGRALERVTIRQLARVIPLDTSVYWQLAHDPVATHPQTCRGCGYTVWDAYSVEDQLLGWADDGRCTGCNPGADATL
jgi:hypothetical protein